LQLSQIIQSLLKFRMTSNEDVEISHITSDSRHVKPGALFVAIPGYTNDGHTFLPAAVQAGAVAALVERVVDGLTIPQIVVPDVRLSAAIAANQFYRQPSTQLNVIGVTGTNGKTTVAHLIEAVLTAAGKNPGLLGTVGKRIGGVTLEVQNTTPDSVDLQAVLAEMVDAGCTHCVMEVSSHALELRRDAGTKYHIAAFTNLTQDHLDFHGTMENYLFAKGKLFSRLGNQYGQTRDESSFTVINTDDPAAAYLRSQTVCEGLTYGIDSDDADVRATNIDVRAHGAAFHLTTPFGETDVQLQLTGRFNVYNALCAIAVGLIEQIPLPVITAALSGVSGVAGRLQPVLAGQPFTVFVDYAHTPDSLQKALQTVREFASARVITVVGCGGDRDTSKRPLMAQVALTHSDVAIYTSDNPRTEDPERILDDMEAGVVRSTNPYVRITDRKTAIAHAIDMAADGDVVLIAGKGHEDYQIVGNLKMHFDDREVAYEAISARQLGH